MHNITDYLLLPEQARWAKEKGFDGECDYFTNDNHIKEPPVRASDTRKNKNYLSPSSYVPTFDQFFGWVLKNWLIGVSHGFIYVDGSVVIHVAINYYFGKEPEYIYHNFFKEDREARIACVNAIIQYIDK